MSKFVVSVLALAALGLLWEKAFCYPYWNEEAEIERWCRKIRCPTRYCPDPIRIKGKCCPICPKPQPVSCSIEGQIFQECGTACPPTCDVPFPDFCTRQCVPGCQCPGGTVLDEKANKCVPRSECSISLPPIDCAVVRCAVPDCLNRITPPGRCCPVCPKPNCAAVLCVVPNCPNPITPKGQCCPVCPKPNCAAVSCILPSCPNPVIPPGQCCPVCPKPNCAAVLCAVPNCPNPITPKGQCCPVCPKPVSCPIEGQIFQECGTACPPTCDVPFPDFCTKQCVPGCQCPGGTVLDEKANKCVPRRKCSKSLPPINCAAVSCILPNCPNPVIPPGQCCSVCPKLPTIESLNCAAVLCALPECLNPVTLKGQCCPVCLRPVEEPEPVPQLGLCQIEGQIYHDCGTACPPTCANPFPGFCTKQCVLGCQCPQGTFLDEMANKCVTSLKQCTCPPDCTHDFCSSNPKALCNVPGPREIPGCFGGRCQLTFCPACYYSKEMRDLPGNCGDCNSPVTSLSCLRNWATCIHNADMWENGSPDPSIMSQEYFKCYRYPCKLRG